MDTKAYVHFKYLKRVVEKLVFGVRVDEVVNIRLVWDVNFKFRSNWKLAWVSVGVDILLVNECCTVGRTECLMMFKLVNCHIRF